MIMADIFLTFLDYQIMDVEYVVHVSTVQRQNEPAMESIRSLA